MRLTTGFDDYKQWRQVGPRKGLPKLATVSLGFREVHAVTERVGRRREGPP